MSSDGNNAIVSTIFNPNLPDLGLIIGLRIVAVDGTNVEGWQHRKILDKIASQTKIPICLAFKKVKFILIVCVAC